MDAGTLVVTSNSALPNGSSPSVVRRERSSGASLQAASFANNVQAVPEPGTMALLTVAGIVAAAAVGGGEGIEATENKEQPGRRTRKRVPRQVVVKPVLTPLPTAFTELTSGRNRSRVAAALFPAGCATFSGKP